MAKAKDNSSKERTEIRTHVTEDGRELKIKIYYDEHGKPWAFQDVTPNGCEIKQIYKRPRQPKEERKPTPPPLTPEEVRAGKRWIDTLPEPDEIDIVRLKNGKTYKVKVYYGDEDWRDVFARLLTVHGEAASRLLGVYIPALEQRK
jgi:hypothetical protein